MFWLALPVQRLLRSLGATVEAVVVALRVKRRGGDLMRALSEVQARARELRELLLAGVFEEGDGATLAHWSNAHPWRVALRARVLGGLAVLEAQPTAALEPVGLATLQLAADMIAAWAGNVIGETEQRAQLGDLALVALAASPLGLLRMATVTGLAAVTPEDVDAIKAAAGDVAGDVAGDLLSQVPWWGWVLVALAARRLFV